jgi:hypothetical protein
MSTMSASFVFSGFHNTSLFCQLAALIAADRCLQLSGYKHLVGLQTKSVGRREASMKPAAPALSMPAGRPACGNIVKLPSVSLDEASR